MSCVSNTGSVLETRLIAKLMQGWLRGVDLNHRSRAAGLLTLSEFIRIKACLFEKTLPAFLSFDFILTTLGSAKVGIIFAMHECPGPVTTRPTLEYSEIMLLQPVFDILSDAHVEQTAPWAP